MIDYEKNIAMAIFWSDRTAKDGKMIVDNSKKWSDMFLQFKRMIVDTPEYQSGKIFLSNMDFDLYSSKQNIYRIILNYNSSIRYLRRITNFNPSSFEEFEFLLALRGY